VPLDELEILATTPDDHVLLIEEALQWLEAQDPDLARIVVLKFYGGLTNEEVAESRGMSVPTVKRQWAYAKARLFRWIREHH